MRKDPIEGIQRVHTQSRASTWGEGQHQIPVRIPKSDNDSVGWFLWWFHRNQRSYLSWRPKWRWHQDPSAVSLAANRSNRETKISSQCWQLFTFIIMLHFDDEHRQIFCLPWLRGDTLLLGLLDFSGYLSTPPRNRMLRCILGRALTIGRLAALFIVSLFRIVYRRIRYCSTIHDATATMDAVLFTAHAVRYYIRTDHYEKSNFVEFNDTRTTIRWKLKRVSWNTNISSRCTFVG